MINLTIPKMKRNFWGHIFSRLLNKQLKPSERDLLNLTINIQHIKEGNDDNNETCF